MFCVLPSYIELALILSPLASGIVVKCLKNKPCYSCRTNKQASGGIQEMKKIGMQKLAKLYSRVGKAGKDTTF